MESVDLMSALQCGQAYVNPLRERVIVLQTHISMLFFVDDLVYKVKKPLSLDFLDYSTLEKRKHFCEEEVRLNRRLAPDVYRGVVPIVRDADGVIRVNGQGETVEYAVEMVRLPADRMMSALLDRGEIDNAQLNEIVRVLVRFQREAATGPGVDQFGTSEEVGRQFEENLRAMEACASNDTDSPGGTIEFSLALLAHVRSFARRWLAGHSGLLDQRISEGRIREGHGDLHTGNICVTDCGIVIYDCIEFSRRFRCRDVACELAFLAMDLDLRCLRGFAAYLLHRYAELTKDPDLPSVADFYKLHLALVRAKVSSLRAEDERVESTERDSARLEAGRYFHLAGAYTLPPALILMCGLPGTGKSTAARAIARPFEAAILRSDVVRKELAGPATGASTRADPNAGIYSTELTQRTYTALQDRAQDALQSGKTVVIDATFHSAAMRQPFFDAAREAGVHCVLVEVQCPREVVRERLRRRADDRNEVSDADWRIYEHMEERFEPPQTFAGGQHLQFDSRDSLDKLVGMVLDRLGGQRSKGQKVNRSTF